MIREDIREDDNEFRERLICKDEVWGMELTRRCNHNPQQPRSRCMMASTTWGRVSVALDGIICLQTLRIGNPTPEVLCRV